jgi:hypothetical protein
MANEERPNERDAKHVLETELRIVLRHADQNGGPDYRSLDDEAAFEVTTVTDPVARAARPFIDKLLDDATIAPDLSRCWMVLLPLRHQTTKGLAGRVIPSLRALEGSGVFAFDRRRAYHLGSLDLSVRAAVIALVADDVEQALSTPEVCAGDGDDHEHRAFWVAGGGGAASSSDGALAALEAELNASNRADNYLKLTKSGAAQTHLFVWVDHETPFHISRAFAAPATIVGQFGLPTRAPVLSEHVDHLWVAHRQTRHGWHWNGVAWNAVQAPEQPAVSERS